MARTIRRHTDPWRRDRLPRWGMIAASWLVLAMGLAGAADAGGEPGPSDPIFQALRVDGRSSAGRIVALNAQTITIATKEGAKEDLPLDRLVKLTREAAPRIAMADDAQVVVLPEGDRLPRVAVGTATGSALEVRSELLGKLTIPLDCLLGLILSTQGQAGAVEARWDQVLVGPRKTEVVWLVNGDRLDGSFLGMDEHAIKFQIDQKPIDVDRTGAVAIGFDPGLVNYPRPKGPFLELALNDGSRLGVTAATLDEGNIRATTRFGQPVRLALGDLVRIVPRTDAVVYLTDRQPAGSQYVSYIGPTRAYRADRAVDGHPFQLAGQAYDRGLGTQSRTLLAYRIQPGDRRFQALVGVDERAGPLGSVVFRVLIDGKERFRSAPLTDRDLPKPVDVDLAGGKTLILDTDFGDRGDVRDLADWVEARIVR